MAPSLCAMISVSERAPTAMNTKTVSSMPYRSGLKRSVNQPDHEADEGPLNEVGDGLFESELQSDVQIHVVVQHERANREETDERTESRALCRAGAAAIEHRVEHCQNKNRQKHRKNSIRHDALHVVGRAIDGRVLLEFPTERAETEQQSSEGEVHCGGTEGCQCQTTVVHSSPPFLGRGQPTSLPSEPLGNARDAPCCDSRSRKISTVFVRVASDNSLTI